MSFATAQGTKKFAQNSGANQGNFKEFENLLFSNVGIGTYLGDTNAETDKLVTSAVKKSIMSGINVIDTAINYRSQKAERSVGKAISELVEDKIITRDQIFLSTKNGYLTNDADVQMEFWEYVKKEYSQKNVIQEGDVTSGYHCMKLPYMEDQLDRSLKNLDVDCIDLMYIHNAIEGQIKDVSREEFLENLKAVFEMYEQKRNEGKIRYYGMATWECFRAAQDRVDYLSLEDMIHMAQTVGGQEHGFRFIQLPYNMNYDQALLAKNQKCGKETVSILNAASKLGVGVFTSVPFMQGRLLAPGTMPEFGDLKPSHRCLQFIRSTPGVLAPLVGQKSAEHVLENIEIMKIPAMTNEEFSVLVNKLTGK